MWPYWLMFLVPMWGALWANQRRNPRFWPSWALVFALFALMIGLRNKVGGDWVTYRNYFNQVSFMNWRQVLSLSDPGYYIINWASARVGGGIFLVNLFCASILIWGTIVFCRDQPSPWLGLVAAVPYMLIVVGMGYTRQAVALGFALLGLDALGNGRVRTFVVWIAIGATFHKSAVLLLPISALASSRNRWLTGALVGVTTLLLYYLLLADYSEALWRNYVTDDYNSSGALIRIIMNVVPAAIFVIFRKRMASDEQERRLWLWMAAFAFGCLPLVLLASTAVDRVALYLIPIQLYVFSRIETLARDDRTRAYSVAGTGLYYGAALFTWLNFADNAHYWVPYRFM